MRMRRPRGTRYTSHASDLRRRLPRSGHEEPQHGRVAGDDSAAVQLRIKNLRDANSEIFAQNNLPGSSERRALGRDGECDPGRDLAAGYQGGAACAGRGVSLGKEPDQGGGGRSSACSRGDATGKPGEESVRAGSSGAGLALPMCGGAGGAGPAPGGGGSGVEEDPPGVAFGEREGCEDIELGGEVHGDGGRAAGDGAGGGGDEALHGDRSWERGEGGGESNGGAEVAFKGVGEVAMFLSLVQHFISSLFIIINIYIQLILKIYDQEEKRVSKFVFQIQF
ncbi:hypothetical protein Cni_G05202 [Canna indica]|uniref:Uncharacterized protein n=1 Tax=Canna indica TaxID=4628 RepID=A0AAQ3Q307_9LILI|nr:hypothetical protein Cni_G05202 [Canna indica]